MFVYAGDAVQTYRSGGEAVTAGAERCVSMKLRRAAADSALIAPAMTMFPVAAALSWAIHAGSDVLGLSPSGTLLFAVTRGLWRSADYWIGIALAALGGGPL